MRRGEKGFGAGEERREGRSGKLRAGFGRSRFEPPLRPARRHLESAWVGERRNVGFRERDGKGREKIFLYFRGPHLSLHSTVKLMANIIIRCSWTYVTSRVRQNLVPHC